MRISRLLVRGVLLIATCEKSFSSWDLITREQFAKTKKINEKSESCNAALHDESFLSICPSLGLYQDSSKNKQCADVEESRIDSFTSLHFI